MKEQQKKAALRSMSEWLAHPQELGKRPARIQCVGTFDFEGLCYYLFKFKKDLFDPKWLLGVCGGYLGDELEHCGHVFSEMKRYDPDAAKKEAIDMIQTIRDYWTQQEQLQRGGRKGGAGNGSFMAFVLMESGAWEKDRFCRELEERWGIRLDKDSADSSGPLMWDQDGVFVTVGLMFAPVPDIRARHKVAANASWEEGDEAVRTHQAHLLVAVMANSGQPSPEVGQMLVKLCDAGLGQKGALGVYMSGMLFEPSFYRGAAAVMNQGEMPCLNWVCVGLRETEKGLDGCTYGMGAFGLDEVEVVGSAADKDELRRFLYEMCGYLLSLNKPISWDVVTLGEGEQWRVTRGQGAMTEGTTLQVAYKTQPL